MRLTGFTEYDVPAFEYNAYKEHGIELKGPWRKGDIFVFRKQSKPTGNDEVPVEAIWKWDQYDYGTVRLFLKKNGSMQQGLARIIPVSGKNDFVYDSTSSRTQLWKQACLVSTRNHVADISGTKQLVTILRELRSKTADLSNTLECLSDISPDTRMALSVLLSKSDGKNSERAESR